MKFGSYVRIKDLGESYTTHEYQMRKMGFKKPKKSRDNFFCQLENMGRESLKTYFFKVFCIEGGYVGIVDIFGNQLLIGKDGVKKVSKKNFNK